MAFRASDYGCTPWCRINQGHFSKNCPGPGRFNDLVPDKDVRVAFDQNEHDSTGVSGNEDWLPSRYRLKAGFTPKQVNEVHRRQFFSVSDRILSSPITGRYPHGT
jgi:hypothetical protein